MPCFVCCYKRINELTINLNNHLLCHSLTYLTSLGNRKGKECYFVLVGAVSPTQSLGRPLLYDVIGVGHRWSWGAACVLPSLSHPYPPLPSLSQPYPPLPSLAPPYPVLPCILVNYQCQEQGKGPYDVIVQLPPRTLPSHVLPAFTPSQPLLTTLTPPYPALPCIALDFSILLSIRDRGGSHMTS